MHATAHPTLFMVDQIEPHSIGGFYLRGSFQCFSKREPGYDTTFYKAFKYCFGQKNSLYHSAEELFIAFGDIHDIAIKHRGEKYRGSYQFHQMFDLVDGPTCNLDGVKELVQKIWIKKIPTQLMLQSGPDENISLLPEGCFRVTKEGQNDRVDTLYSEHDPVSLERVYEEWIEAFQNKKRLFVFNQTPQAERFRLIANAANTYLNSLKSSAPAEKQTIIRAIATFMQDLMQLHYFNDGNGRACYLFANLLMLQNGLPPFYPDNMCLFDANSVEEMVFQINKGMKTFTEKFDSIEHLETSLSKYYQTVEALKELVHHKAPSIDKNLTKQRRFEHLLRKVAKNSDYLDVVAFLIRNAFSLGIDLFARGDKSGKTALESAIQFKNQEAEALLSCCLSEKSEELQALALKHHILEEIEEAFPQALFLKSIQEELREVFVFLLENASFFDLDLKHALECAKESKNEAAVSLIEEVYLRKFSEKVSKLIDLLKDEPNLQQLVYKKEFGSLFSTLKKTLDNPYLLFTEEDLSDDNQTEKTRQDLLEKAFNLLKNNKSLFEIGG